MPSRGRHFFKMSGSGNDFLFLDARDNAAAELETPERIAALCARGTGVGADGVVFFDRDDSAAFSIRYYNSDGSRASLCGNASLCASRLAVDLGAARAEGFQFRTDAGVLTARMLNSGPELDMGTVGDVREIATGIMPVSGERRIGFALVGVPHLVVLVDNVDSVDVVGRGAALRHDSSLQDGANVNFVARVGGTDWRIRTFERGVEGETLACGTGAVATAILLLAWDEARSPVRLETRSGKVLSIAAERAREGWTARLSGEGRLVFTGELGDV